MREYLIVLRDACDELGGAEEPRGIGRLTASSGRQVLNRQYVARIIRDGQQIDDDGLGSEAAQLAQRRIRIGQVLQDTGRKHKGRAAIGGVRKRWMETERAIGELPL